MVGMAILALACDPNGNKQPTVTNSIPADRQESVERFRNRLTPTATRTATATPTAEPTIYIVAATPTKRPFIPLPSRADLGSRAVGAVDTWPEDFDVVHQPDGPNQSRDQANSNPKTPFAPR